MLQPQDLLSTLPTEILDEIISQVSEPRLTAASVPLRVIDSFASGQEQPLPGLSLVV